MQVTLRANDDETPDPRDLTHELCPSAPWFVEVIRASRDRPASMAAQWLTTETWGDRAVDRACDPIWPMSCCLRR